MRKPLSIFCFVFCFLNSLSGQPLYSHYKLFKVEDGLPQNFISGLQQDNNGFLWIGTRDGLARYDGRQFKIFRHTPTDSNSLASNIIRGLYQGPDKTLYVFYEDASLDIFNPQTFVVKHTRFALQPPPATVTQTIFFVDKTGKIWKSDKGDDLECYDPHRNQKIKFGTDNRMLCNVFFDMKEDVKKRIWVFGNKGLEMISSGKIYSFPFPPHISFQYNSLVGYLLTVLPDERIIMSDKGRFILFDPATKIFSTLSFPEKFFTGAEYISHLLVSSGGNLYFEETGRLFRLEKNNDFSFLWNYKGRNKYAISLFVDRSEVMWYGTNAAGLYRINLESLPFAAYPYDELISSDSLPPGYDNKNKDFFSLWNRNQWIVNTRFSYSPDGSLAVVYNANSLPKIDHWQNERITKIMLPALNFSALMGIDYDLDGSLFVLSDSGHLLKWTNILQPPQLYLFEERSDLKKATDIEADGETIWIATSDKGLLKTKEGKVIQHFQKGSLSKDLPGNQLTDIIADPHNRNHLWIGTKGLGLILWDKEKGTQKIFTVNEGLPNNTINCITGDAKNRLWFSTNNGICCFDPVSYKAYNFDVNDGLPSNEFDGFRYFLFPDGKMAFGGEKIVLFDPAAFVPDAFSTPVQLTRLLINNKTPESFDEEELKSIVITELQSLHLPYNKNFLQFEFAGLQFNQPEKLRYRYFLKNYDKGWIEAGSHNIASYTKLPPGEYTLMLNASNTSGEWSKEIKTLSIVIAPPFWATWWAYAFYILVALALARVYWKYRENRLRMKNEILLEHNKALHLEEVNEIKNRFFSNITHELRTPLTLILTPLEKISKEQSLSPVHQKTLVNAHRNAEQLLRLINQMLDVSKLEAGQMKLHTSTGELDVFIKNCVSQFMQLAKEKGIQLSFINNDVSGYYSFDEEKWEKIIFNLLSNAIRFTPANGKVAVALRSTGSNGVHDMENIQLEIKDTGIGIQEKNLAAIFNRFYMEDDSATRNYSGTGIGLSLVQELTQLMKGSIEVKSKQGEGSIFIVTIPAEKTTQKAATDFSVLLYGENTTQLAKEKKEDQKLVLVVEDNDELRSFLIENLKPSYHVLEAGDGKQAWDIILKELPELVITDIMMPEMDGVELCRLSKNDLRTAHISFIMLTAKAAHNSRVTGLEAGADEYLSKPFYVDELELRIRNIFNQQEAWTKHLQQEALPEKPWPKLPHVNDIFLQQLYKELDIRLEESTLDVEALAAAVHMSRRTLNRKLKTLLNVSPNELIRRYRLQKAAILLSSGHGVTHTAYTVGFETPSYFTQCFKDQYGQTPTEFASQKTA